jgi:hypothetical protein
LAENLKIIGSCVTHYLASLLTLFADISPLIEKVYAMLGILALVIPFVAHQ